MKPKRLNATPTAIAPLFKLALLALRGARAHGDAAGLRHHRAERIEADLTAFGGAEAAGLSAAAVAATEDGRAEAPRPGAEARLHAALARAAAARRAYAQARQQAQAYCATALDALKSRFGRKWNGRWAEAGFEWGTLEVSREPLAMLWDLRDYFLSHPERENAGLEVSARRCEEVGAAWTAARLACNDAKAEALLARRERNLAVERLYRRVSGLRQELSMLLGEEDERWYWFGFRCPAEGRSPGEVKGVRAEAGAPGEVRVSWEGAARAKGYRVSWQSLEEAPGEEPGSAPVEREREQERPGEEMDQVDAVDRVDEVDAANAARAKQEPELKPRKTPAPAAEAERASGPVEAGLFRDRETVLRGLPQGARVLIRVSARNRSGESAPVEVFAVVAQTREEAPVRPEAIGLAALAASESCETYEGLAAAPHPVSHAAAERGIHPAIGAKP